MVARDACAKPFPGGVNPEFPTIMIVQLSAMRRSRWHRDTSPCKLNTRPLTVLATTDYLQEKESVAIDAVFGSFHRRHCGPSTHRHKDVICRVVHSLHPHSLGPNKRAVLHHPSARPNRQARRAQHTAGRMYGETIDYFVMHRYSTDKCIMCCCIICCSVASGSLYRSGTHLFADRARLPFLIAVTGKIRQE